ncbi:ATP-dependent RNA helicase DEAH11, chloroplastic-like [Olea europaea subsp. europaea]|uniref:RNA helicase n=1 Tax=Olea europaea subsp. europaea TaxID=158383 RepID=A0A8S0SPT9_OLEEU|nr:ATP-dependent RNA helicase DEAH11, chloroplastic-like [Olea europaea subsp. europaea]
MDSTKYVAYKSELTIAKHTLKCYKGLPIYVYRPAENSADRRDQLTLISCITADEAQERSSSIDFFLAITKNLLGQRPDLRLIIMSATADADQLANYNFCSGTFHVAGRNYPIDINMPRSMKGLLEPEILMIRLGVAVLRILALGIKNVQDFDFVDAPSVRTIEMAIINIQLGAVVVRDGVHELKKRRLGFSRVGKCGNALWYNQLGYKVASTGTRSTVFVTVSGGTYRFCPSPDCPSVYRVEIMGLHANYLPVEFKDGPDSSLQECSKWRENVRKYSCCGFTIEKMDGCNHIECRCGRHVCWVCLKCFGRIDECYGHLRSVHLGII